MSVHIYMHDIDRVELSSPVSRGVSNAMAIGFYGEMERHEITIFGLPDHIADALAEGIRAASKAQPMTAEVTE